MLARLILSVAAWSLLAAQDTTIRLDVRQVLVPVVVTDRKGHHVSGLHASDFRILEDGVPQEIAAFSNDTAGSVDEVGALSRPSPGSPPRGAPRHTFVICIDTLHISPASGARLRQALDALFEKEKSSDAQYVLIGIGRQLQVLQPATTNPLAIRLKIRSAGFQGDLAGRDAAALAAQLQNIRGRLDELCRRCACGVRAGRQNCDSEIETLKQSVDAEADRWIAPANGLLEQFQKVVEELAKLPTGRTLILVSDGFSVDPKQEFYRTVAAYLPNAPQFKWNGSAKGLSEALKVAAASAIIIDAIDLRGGAAASLASAGPMDAASGAPASGASMLGTVNRSAAPPRTDVLRAATDARADPFEPSVPMEQLARSTGGVYSHDSNDMLKQFRAALADGREYYVLSYVPKNKTLDGKFRGISVETTGGKLNVRAKPGYWAAQ